MPKTAATGLNPAAPCKRASREIVAVCGGLAKPPAAFSPMRQRERVVPAGSAGDSVDGWGRLVKRDTFSLADTWDLYFDKPGASSTKSSCLWPPPENPCRPRPRNVSAPPLRRRSSNLSIRYQHSHAECLDTFAVGVRPQRSRQAESDPITLQSRLTEHPH